MFTIKVCPQMTLIRLVKTELWRSLFFRFYFGTACHAGKYYQQSVCIINHTPHLLEQYIS